jgi:NAD(P)-dependent dehydrogenase (short-subunit alcohol dehydrogenase family)
MSKDSAIKKTVVVTGGTKGIGEGISRVFIEQGWYVVMGSRNNSGLAKELGERARYVKTDVKELNDHRNLVKTAKDWTNRLDAYVNCAGFSKWRPVSEIDEALWDEMMNVNLKGTFWGCKAAAEGLSDSGSIINVSSLAGKRGSANNSVYCASKFGVNGLTQSLAKELGSKGIRVNAVCPVYVRTEGVLDALKGKDSPAGGQDVGKYLDDFRKNNAALKRLPTAEEVGRVCFFLASDAASAITGQCINVDCGVLPS